MPHILESLAGRNKITLSGDMGAGKTTFVGVFCRLMGTHEAASSPTYALINEYAYTDASGALGLVHHLDLYRLNSLQEALDIGVEDVLYDPWFCLIEWPQLIESILPENVARIQLEILGETERRITVY